MRPALNWGCDRIAPLNPCVQYIFEAFRHKSIGQLFMRDQVGGRKASPRNGFRDTCWMTLV